MTDRRKAWLCTCILMPAVMISACGGGGGDTTSQEGRASQAPVTSISEAFAAAEASGSIPVLDRENSLLGVDANGNHIRDDIDKYIAQLPDTPAQKKALIQLAVAINATLTVDTSSQAALRMVSSLITKSVVCVHSSYPVTISSRKLKDIQKYTVNTKLRFTAYERFNAALSSGAFKVPPGDGCDR